MGKLDEQLDALDAERNEAAALPEVYDGYVNTTRVLHAVSQIGRSYHLRPNLPSPYIDLACSRTEAAEAVG